MSNEIKNSFFQKYLKYKRKFLKAGSDSSEAKLYLNTNLIEENIDEERREHNSKGKNIMPTRGHYYTIEISSGTPLSNYFYSTEIIKQEVTQNMLLSAYSNIYERVKENPNLNVHDLIVTMNKWDITSLSPMPNPTIPLDKLNIGYLNNPKNKLFSFYVNIDKSLTLLAGQKFYLTE